MLPYGGNALPVRQAFGHPSVDYSPSSGLQGTYALYADATQRAAKMLGYRRANQLQGVTWQGAQSLFDRGFKTKANKAAVEDLLGRLRSGSISREKYMDRVFNLAGGFSTPGWQPR
jgi:hypothetical protein